MDSLFSFIRSAPTAYQGVESVKVTLRAHGFIERAEGDASPYKNDTGYFVTRADSSLIAFVYRKGALGFRIAAAHTDAPAFRVKIHAEKLCASYTGLETEPYGGMIHASWFDRPLSVAGRLIVREETGDLTVKPVCIDRDLCVIPSVAIHLDRTVNDGRKYNPAVDLLPLFSTEAPAGKFTSLLAKAAGVRPEDIVSHDLFLYNRDEGKLLGADGDLILCPRLDDLACVYACLNGFLAADQTDLIPVLALFNNEEVGSATKQGAASTFLFDTLKDLGGERYGRMLTDSFMVSADNAHAKHPNHPELSDPDAAPLLGGGIAVKYNASQRYATDGVSDAAFREICRRAGVKTQRYCNRADLPGGSTLGSIADTKVSVPTVDVGIPQLAMHSACECCAAADVWNAEEAMRTFFTSPMHLCGDRIRFR